MAIYRGTGGAGDADNDATITEVTQQANNAAASASAAATSASNASTSASNASTSASTATSEASDASASATAAGVSATNASASESAASASATAAASSASAASTSASNAATSETNAAASYDDFDDRYLGAKASAPATDNDGDALITGALYFNTVTNAMQVYNGTAWTVLTGTGAAETNDLTAAVTWANVPDANITQSSVTQHQAALSITESQVSDLGSYITGNQTITLSGDASGSGTTSIAVTVADDSHNHIISNVDGLQTALDAKLESVAINDVSDVVITTPADNEVLAYDTTSGNWINQTASEAGLLTTETNDLTAAVTWANVPDANITQSSVTQHQAALSITESQISDLAHTTSLAFAAITSTPTTLSGYGITDAATSAQGALADSAVQPNDSVTLDDLTITGAIDEAVYNLTGTALDPVNGTIQYKTLGANTTLTDSLSEGEAITLMIDDGSAYTLTFPTITWVNDGGTAPTLATAGYTVFVLWKVSTTLYGALVGDGS
jgi:predicted XRE-type DNA-binding protein